MTTDKQVTPCDAGKKISTHAALLGGLVKP